MKIIVVKHNPKQGPMDSNATKPKRDRSTHGRVRGIVLSPHGWQRFQTAKQQAESEETWNKRFTQEDLSDRTGLSLNTLARILKREQGVDRCR
ncbi:MULTISPECIES: hypothetical protein [Nostoc]|uniref:Transcriptional regulator n=2 Tax=Nostoc TaxID=1177 RepID=A0ABR8IBK7_9NOSO|nr:MULTISPECIES: hypothetical protein [Nostoc]MBD2562290.1 hypothetical protein [Nostoc linckia FACHB-391]MBD2647935.1 hypothetical protein [Nostoc foliaceum FACHB-393]